MRHDHGVIASARAPAGDRGGYLTLTQIASALLVPGRTSQQVLAQLQYFQKRGYLTPVTQESEGRHAYLYRDDAGLVAEALIRMSEMGIASTEAAVAVAGTLEKWRPDDYEGDEPPAQTPGMHVINQYRAGARDWAVELWSMSDRDSGDVRLTARLYARGRNEGTSWTLPVEGHDLRGVFAIDLSGVLDRVRPMRVTH